MSDSAPETPLSDVTPLRHKMERDEWYDSLDPGIRFAVRVLHAHGIDTGQSCQAGPGHCYDHPTVDLATTDPTTGQGLAAVAALVQYGLPVMALSFRYGVLHGLPTEAFWRIEFSQAMPERADDRPMFVWGYICDPRAC